MPELEIGQVMPEVVVQLTRADIVRYAGASGDFNEIHYSDRRARAIGLGGVVAHGMWTMGAALRVVTDVIGDPARVISYQVRFTRPVLVPDDDEGVEVRFGGEVTGIDDGVATISVTARCGEHAVLGAARAEVRL